MTKKYDFIESYPGPHGPHLNCVSQYTMTRKDEDRLRGNGIHSHGKPAKNTCGVSAGKRQARSIAALQQHLLRHPNDKQSETHLGALGGSKLEAA